MDLDFLSRLASIIVIDLVLSGDNAVVIGMAARSLPVEQRRRAIIFGGGAAVGLRILFTAMAALLLGVPLLQAIGGAVLLWIALKLLLQREHDPDSIHEGRNMFDAIRTIVLADVVMSLDNILAVGGAAHGNLFLLLFGLAFSIPLLLVGSEVVARLLGRFPWLVWVGSGILAWTAATMIIEDPRVHSEVLTRFFAEDAIIWLERGFPAAITLLILALGFLLRRRVSEGAPLAPSRGADLPRV